MSYNCKLEYLWLDGYKTSNLRSKTKYVNLPAESGVLSIDDIPEWGFDGSSTEQADGDNSDCILRPVSLFNNTVDAIAGTNSYIVMCEVFNTDGTPHKSNTRALLRSYIEDGEDKEITDGMWFGIEQEYTIMDPKSGRPLGWPESRFEYPAPQGRYYCGVGGDVVKMRQLVHEHAMCCITAGIPLCGTNAEVMLGQWEYQVGPQSALKICDSLWVARYMLEVLAETQDVYISLDPKLITGDWNGSGAHINFSTSYMRDQGGEEYIENICKSLGEKHDWHIANYGDGNEDRLTGSHETQHISKFSYGDSDRSASIRVPSSTASNKKGYLEDRRPASNMDPYRAVRCLVSTISVVDAEHQWQTV
tara:strand:- start:14853 stop:15938 length:1086 start_codon:yes stop_codon:yes gene_type:complete